jgi:hypothetical protein
MTESIPFAVGPRQLRHAAWMLLTAWTLAIAASVGWNVYLVRDAMFEAAVTDARSGCDKDMLYRHWAASMGGVYVPVTALTPPHPCSSSPCATGPT